MLNLAKKRNKKHCYIIKYNKQSATGEYSNE